MNAIVPTVVFANNANSTLPGSLSATAGTITIQTADAALFPQIGAGQYFMVTIEDLRTTPIQREICRCTSISANTLFVMRAQENTVAQAFQAGATVSARFTAGALMSIQQPAGVLVPLSLDGYATAPIANTNGAPLMMGQLYFNTVSSTLYQWTGAAWQSVPANTYSSAAGLYIGFFASPPATAANNAPLLPGMLYYNTILGEVLAYSGSVWMPAVNVSLANAASALNAQAAAAAVASQVLTSGGTLDGTLAWELDFTNSGTVMATGSCGQATTINVIDTRMSNAVTNGGTYVGTNGVDSVVRQNYTIYGAPPNGVWAYSDGLYLAGAGDGASAGNAHVNRYLTTYRENLPVTHTTVTSATPGSPTTTITVADGTSLGWGYMNTGGAVQVSALHPQSIMGQSGTIYQVIGYTGNAGTDLEGGPTGSTVLTLSGPMSVADATNGAAITNAIPSSSVTLATFTLAITGTVATISGISGAVKVGDYLAGTSPGTRITSPGTGTGGNGTYNINNPQSLTAFSSSVELFQVRGAALISSVYELADYSGYSTDISGAQENQEYDNRGVASDPIGQRKCELHYLQLATTLLMLSQTGTIGATTLNVAQPTWPGCGYYPQMSRPRPGFFLLGPGIANGTTVVSSTSLGLMSTSGPAVLGNVYTYDTFQITISQPLTGTIAAYSFNSGAEITTSNFVEFSQDIQTFVLSPATLDIAWQFAGGGTIATSGIDTTAITLGPNASLIRGGRNHQVLLSAGQNYDAGRSQITQGATSTPQYNFFRIIQQQRENTLVPGLMIPQGSTFTAAGTITATDIGYLVGVFAASVISVTMPLSTAVPADGVFASYNGTELLQRLIVQGSDVIYIETTGPTATYDMFPGDLIIWRVGSAGLWSPIRTNVFGECGPVLTVAQLQAMVAAGIQPVSMFRCAVASNGRDVGEGAGLGTGVRVMVKNGGSGLAFYTSANTVVAS